MLRIWGRLSSINVRKVVLCAQVLGLQFERIDAGLSYGVVNTPDYRAKNPNGLVPLLEDGVALARELQRPEQVAFGLVFLGCTLQQAGDQARALALLEESLPWWDRARSKGGRSLALFWLADVLRDMGEYDRARACLEGGRALSQALDDRFGTAFHVADHPNAGHVGLQFAVVLDVAGHVGGDAGLVESEIVGVRHLADADEQM